MTNYYQPMTLVTHYLEQGLEAQALDWLALANLQYHQRHQTALLSGEVLDLAHVTPCPTRSDQQHCPYCDICNGARRTSCRGCGGRWA